MNTVKAICKESFTIAGRGIILDLMHSEQGLKQGTILYSEKTKLEWSVECRVLFDHAVDIQKVFENEFANFMLLHFANEEKRQESRNKIIENEQNNIFQYLIKPIRHQYKPEEGEFLIITS